MFEVRVSSEKLLVEANCLALSCISKQNDNGKDNNSGNLWCFCEILTRSKFCIKLIQCY
jgi:hypothetical protein